MWFWALVAHVVVKGDTLDAICAERYGDRVYANLIAAVEHLEPTKLAVGQVVLLPDLSAFGPDALADGVARFRRLEPVLRQHMLDDNDKVELRSIAAELDGVVPRLPPRSADQIKRGAETMRAMTVELDEYGYDVSLVHQRIAYGLTDLIKGR